jgi:hypothetical protein
MQIERLCCLHGKRTIRSTVVAMAWNPMQPLHPKESAMHLDLHQALVPLTSPVPLRLQSARGTRVRSLAGTLWVTVDGNDTDHVLQRGESWLVDSDAPVLVAPLQGTATVGLSDQPEPAARPAVRQIGRLLHALWPARGAQGRLPEVA